jgi:hypothetical protein
MRMKNKMERTLEIIEAVKKLKECYALSKQALEKITQAYEADIYSLSDAIMLAEDTLDTLDKMEKGVTI